MNTFSFETEIDKLNIKVDESRNKLDLMMCRVSKSMLLLDKEVFRTK